MRQVPSYLAGSSSLQSDEHPGQGQGTAHHRATAPVCAGEFAVDFVVAKLVGVSIPRSCGAFLACCCNDLFVAKVFGFRGIHPTVLRGLPRVLR